MTTDRTISSQDQRSRLGDVALVMKVRKTTSALYRVRGGGGSSSWFTRRTPAFRVVTCGTCNPAFAHHRPEEPLRASDVHRKDANAFKMKTKCSRKDAATKTPTQPNTAQSAVSTIPTVKPTEQSCEDVGAVR